VLGYVTIGVSDMEKGKSFWGALLGEIGAKPIVDMGRMVLYSAGRDQPMLGICTPYDEQSMHPGNGNMLAFSAASREDVDRLYAKAIELGGTDEGEPGERGPTFYGGYFRDPDGNKAVFFQAG
jgi:predicted lactoylglutathione lyase